MIVAWSKDGLDEKAPGETAMVVAKERRHCQKTVSTEDEKPV